ncbi:hypothetical protein BH24DEI1_BH24DEI1_04180 [soil metagenome]
MRLTWIPTPGRMRRLLSRLERQTTSKLYNGGRCVRTLDCDVYPFRNLSLRAPRGLSKALAMTGTP